LGNLKPAVIGYIALRMMFADHELFDGNTIFVVMPATAKSPWLF